MRIEATATTMSWIPSESVWTPMRMAFEMGLTHFDEPLPDTVSGPDEVQELCRQDRFRFANVLSGWAEVEDGRIIDCGLGEESGLVMGSTTMRVGRVGATFRAARLPTLRPEPEHDGDSVSFSQTVGGHTGVTAAAPGLAQAVRAVDRADGLDHPAADAARRRPQGRASSPVPARSPGTGCTAPTAGSPTRAA